MKGNRSWRAITRAPLRRGHYRGLFGAFEVFERPAENLKRYLTAGGTYPYAPHLRTPVGVVAPLLHTSHDMSTVHEVFARRDYDAGKGLRLAVDVGANIGISALFFLTRSPHARAVLFEPNPANVERLRRNLTGYEDRYELHEAAVGLDSGEVEFGVEWTGRYGGIGVDAEKTIRVACVEINDVLATILTTHDTINVLKIDVEGLERELVAAIRPDLLDSIDVIYYETNRPEPLHGDRYAYRFDCQTNRLQHRGRR